MPEEKKVGFSYQSSEKQQKNAARSLGLELSVLLVAIIFIIAILIYLKILSIDKILPFLNTQKHTENTNTKIEKGRIPTIAISKDIKATLTSESEIPGTKLSILNKDDFIAKLKEMGILGRVYAIHAGDNTPVDTINILLTNKEQPEHKMKRVNEGTVYSSKTTFSKNIININIYLTDKSLKDGKLSSKDKGSLVQEAFIVALYSYAHAYDPADKIQKEYVKILQDMGKNNHIYFRVE